MCEMLYSMDVSTKEKPRFLTGLEDRNPCWPGGQRAALENHVSDDLQVGVGVQQLKGGQKEGVSGPERKLHKDNRKSLGSQCWW